MNIPNFDSKAERIEFLVENKKSLIAQKRAEIKHADSLSAMYYDIKEDTIKANNSFVPNGDEIKVKVVINTTNLMDSHDDVHIKGIWGKSVKENKMIMHLQEHKMAFDSIISDGKDLKAFTKTFSWKELGYKYEGETQALIFDSTVKKERNEFMFNQYSKGFVNNHSVGMQYVQLELAANDDRYEDEFKVWNKYIDTIANKELAEEKGYFWAVREAKVIEGSAVPIGSNTATPTLDNNMKGEPSKDTHNEPQKSTHEGINFDYLLEHI